MWVFCRCKFLIIWRFVEILASFRLIKWSCSLTFLFSTRNELFLILNHQIWLHFLLLIQLLSKSLDIIFHNWFRFFLMTYKWLYRLQNSTLRCWRRFLILQTEISCNQKENRRYRWFLRYFDSNLSFFLLFFIKC